MGPDREAKKIFMTDPAAGSAAGVIFLFSGLYASAVRASLPVNDPFRATGNECCPLGTKDF